MYENANVYVTVYVYAYAYGYGYHAYMYVENGCAYVSGYPGACTGSNAHARTRTQAMHKHAQAHAPANVRAHVAHIYVHGQARVYSIRACSANPRADPRLHPHLTASMYELG